MPKKVVAVVPEAAWNWLMEDAQLTAGSSAADADYRRTQKEALAQVRTQYVTGNPVILERRFARDLLEFLRNMEDGQNDDIGRTYKGYADPLEKAIKAKVD